MIRFLLIGCVVFVAGCSDEKKIQEERSKEQLKQFYNQEYDHRSLEERVRASCAPDALGKKPDACGKKKEQQ